jgi:transposase
MRNGWRDGLAGRGGCGSRQVFEVLPEGIMWTPTSRVQHSRAGLRYGSDLTDAEWAILAPLLPPPSRFGRKRKWPVRRIIEAIFHVLRAGCAWEMLPDGFLPLSTVCRWFARFRDDGTWEAINHHLLIHDRERAGRAASPSAAVLDSQSAKTAGPRGYDAGKKIKSRKWHALVDTDGRALKLHVHAANVQDRDEAGPLLRASRQRSHSLSGCLPTAPTRASAWPRPPASPSRSCARPPTKSASQG